MNSFYLAISTVSLIALTTGAESTVNNSIEQGVSNFEGNTGVNISAALEGTGYTVKEVRFNDPKGTWVVLAEKFHSPTNDVEISAEAVKKIIREQNSLQTFLENMRRASKSASFSAEGVYPESFGASESMRGYCSGIVGKRDLLKYYGNMQVTKDIITFRDNGFDASETPFLSGEFRFMCKDNVPITPADNISLGRDAMIAHAELSRIRKEINDLCDEYVRNHQNVAREYADAKRAGLALSNSHPENGIYSDLDVILANIRDQGLRDILTPRINEIRKKGIEERMLTRREAYSIESAAAQKKRVNILSFGASHRYKVLPEHINFIRVGSPI